MESELENVEIIKKKTLEVLGSKNSDDVEHITEELLVKFTNSPKPDEEEGVLSKNRGVFYGHDMAYVFSERYQEYGYQFVSGLRNAHRSDCGSAYGYFLPHNEYDHDKVGTCSGNDAMLKFTPK